MPSRAGSPNKNKAFLLKRLQDMYGEDFHPIMQMAEIASTEENDIRLRFDAWKEIAKYTEPQLKAVEHTGEDGGPLQAIARIELVPLSADSSD